MLFVNALRHFLEQPAGQQSLSRCRLSGAAARVEQCLSKHCEDELFAFFALCERQATCLFAWNTTASMESVLHLLSCQHVYSPHKICPQIIKEYRDSIPKNSYQIIVFVIFSKIFFVPYLSHLTNNKLTCSILHIRGGKVIL